MSMTTVAQTERVRKIRVYRNGDENFIGKEFVLNPRQIRTFDRFLQSVTGHIQLDQAARSIRTPRHGTRLKSLDEIENNREYVAVGYGRFKDIGYLNIQDRQLQRLRDARRIKEEPIRVVEHSRIQTSGRIRKVISDVIPIYVYSNGDEMTQAKRIILTFRMMQSWGMILAEINQHINPQFSATKALYTLEGTPVKHKSDVKPGGTYVAVGSRAPFKAVDYGKYGKPAFTVSPRIKRRMFLSDMAAVHNQDRKSRMRSQDDASNSAESSNLPPLSTQSEPVIENRATTIKFRRARDARLVYSDGRDVFHSKPVKVSRSRPAPVADYDKDEGGVFKARSRRHETQDAEEISETGDTATDEPVDQRRALQIDEEDLELDSHEHDDNKQVQMDDEQRHDDVITAYESPREDERSLSVIGDYQPTPSPRPDSVRIIDEIDTSGTDEQRQPVTGEQQPAAMTSPRPDDDDELQPTSPDVRQQTPAPEHTKADGSSSPPPTSPARQPTPVPPVGIVVKSPTPPTSPARQPTPVPPVDIVVKSPTPPTSPTQLTPVPPVDIVVKSPTPPTSPGRDDATSPRPPHDGDEMPDNMDETQAVEPAGNEENEDKVENQAAVKVQKVYRGYRTRKQLRTKPTEDNN